ncbi:MAG: hypothetical protein JW864_16455 [Spirochaetes bacterium]|nr:hypothetical protein [Spirochaetota bacterium]
MSKRQKISVQCYSGYKANERPVSFKTGENSLKVSEILDTWYGEDYTYFKLLADDGNTYILKYQANNDKWELDFFRNKILYI